MRQHPPAHVLADALRLPAYDRLALAAELLDSVAEANDPEWEAAWLAELDRRAEQVVSDPSASEDWESVRDRLLNELRSKCGALS
jgi:putative addiction module component (TIGR02574 family)